MYEFIAFIENSIMQKVYTEKMANNKFILGFLIIIFHLL